MKSKLVLSGIIVIALVLLLSGCITSSYDKNVQNASTEAKPTFSALRTNDTTIMIMYLSAGGAEDVKGLHVVSPAISSPDLVDQNTSVPTGKEIRITDPALSGKVELIVTSSVDGTTITVLDGTV